MSATPSGTARIGRYRLVRPLSKGGMALVYEGRRESLAGVSPRVAIKIILPEHAKSADFKDLFINEARLGASMHHQNLVQIQDFDAENDNYFLVMEYVEGFTLRKAISLAEKAGVYIPLGVIAEVGRQACDGLHYAHTARDEEGRPLHLVHRDIKPSNLILGPHGVVKILDFGISKGRLREEKKGSVRGTWGYMSPEQAAGSEVAPTCDLFGLAIVLYELAALKPMFGDLGKDDIRRQLRDDHAARMAVTLDGAKYGPLVQVLVHALQRDPKARPEDAEVFGRALAGLVPDPVTARDELTRFYEQIVEVEAGLPPGAPSISERSATPPDDPQQMDLGGFAAVAGGVTATLAVAAGVLAIGGMVWWVGNTPREVVVSAPADRPPVMAAGTPAAPIPPPEPRRMFRSKRDASVDPAASLWDAARPPPADMLVEPLPADGAAAGGVPTAEPALLEDDAVAATPAALVDGAEIGGLSKALVTGDVWIEARQAAEVYVDGRFMSDAPFKGALPVGRHQVTLVAEDRRSETFDIVVAVGDRIRKTYDFDRGDFR